MAVEVEKGRFNVATYTHMHTHDAHTRVRLLLFLPDAFEGTTYCVACSRAQWCSELCPDLVVVVVVIVVKLPCLPLAKVKRKAPGKLLARGIRSKAL